MKNSTTQSSEKSRGKCEPPLPHSKEAEVALLGAVLLDTNGAPEAIDQLQWTDFHLPFHRTIFRAMKKLKAEGRPANDLVVLCDALQTANELEAAGGFPYVASLPDGQPKVVNLPHYVDIIKTKALLRKAIAISELNTKKLWTANGDASDVLRQVADSFCPYKESSLGRNNSDLFMTAADLAEESTVTEFVVEPYVLAGAVTELVAKIKTGKTTYVLGEIVRRALEKGPVVYLTEQPTASFKVALKRAGLLDAKNLFILPFSAVAGTGWPNIANIAIDQCKHTTAVMLVVDTLSRFCGLDGDGDKENSSGAALEAMKPLQVVADTGIAVLTLRHERKSGGEIGDAGRGSSAFGGAADTLLTLRRLEGRTRSILRKIECISRFDGLLEEAIYEYVDGHYQYAGTENGISEREAEEVILANSPDCEEKAKDLDDLLKGSKVARTTAQRVLKKLVGEGKLIEIGKGKKGDPFRYFLPEKVSAQTTHIYGQKEFRADFEDDQEVHL